MALGFTICMEPSESALRTVKISGQGLVALWRESAMSQASFAEAIGMKRAGLLRLLQSGEHRMFTDNFRRLAEAVRMSPEELRRRIGAEGEAAFTGISAAMVSVPAPLPPVPRAAAIVWPAWRASPNRSAKSPDFTESAPGGAMNAWPCSKAR